jgi:hypothetical protein
LNIVVPGLRLLGCLGHSTKGTAAIGKLPVKDEKQLPCQVTRGHWQMISQADQGWAKIGS